jgi:hypothetical protein
MRFRKLRIAWSVVFGVLCLLLIVLWVRSYWRADRCLVKISSTRMLDASSCWGEARVFIKSWSRAPIPAAGLESRPANRLHVLSVAGRPADSDLGMMIPHYSLALLAAGVAMVPWIRRFSLRTLLIATALIAAFLASAVSSNLLMEVQPLPVP